MPIVSKDITSSIETILTLLEQLSARIDNSSKEHGDLIANVKDFDRRLLALKGTLGEGESSLLIRVHDLEKQLGTNTGKAVAKMDRDTKILIAAVTGILGIAGAALTMWVKVH